MNFPRILPGAALACGALFTFAGEVRAQQKPVIRDAATNETLSRDIQKQQANTALKSSTGVKLAPAKADEIAAIQKKKEEQAASLEQSSVLFASNGSWVSVPSASVLFVPPLHATKVVKAPSGNIAYWADFYANNRTWIIPLEVKLEQIQGKAPIEASVVNTWKTRNCVVVAVYRGSPVGIINPPKVNP